MQKTLSVDLDVGHLFFGIHILRLGHENVQILICIFEIML